MNTDQKNVRRVDGKVFAAVWAGVIAAGGLLLHAMGFISNVAYLKHLGVDSGAFPKNVDWTLIQGYYSYLDRSSAVLKGLVAHGLEVLFAIIFMGTLLLAIEFMLGKALQPKQLAPWMRAAIKSYSLAAVALLGVPVLLLFISFIIIWPGMFGEVAGMNAAQQDLKKFQKGCAAQKQNERKCQTVILDGKSIAYGFLIDSSEKYLAVFDVDQKRSIVLEREHTKIISDKLL